MRAASLFAGIGGFDLAMERAGIEVYAVAEIDAGCREDIGHHFPEAIQFDDVRKVTGDALECDIDIVTAGWPCQGNSVAGLRKGMEDERSGLWSEVARILRDLRPRWFVGENVPGLLTVNDGRDFLAVKDSLVELGYGVAWRVLDAQYTGVPQRRRRVIIVGCLGGPASAAEVLFDLEGSYGDLEACGEARQEASGAVVVSTLQGGGRRGYRVDAESAAGGHLVVCVTGSVTHTLTAEGADASEDGSGRGTPIVTCASGDVVNALTAPGCKGVDSDANGIVCTSVGVRRLTPIECERLQGFPDGWTYGSSDSARYRRLGNAVAVPVIAWAMRRLVAVDSAAALAALRERLAV